MDGLIDMIGKPSRRGILKGAAVAAGRVGAGLDQAVDLVRQRFGDEKNRKEIPERANRELRGDLMDAAYPLARLFTSTEMAASGRANDHSIHEPGPVNQRLIGPLDGLLKMGGLQMRYRKAELEKMT